MEHNDCLHVVSLLQLRIRETPTDNIIILQNYFQTNCQIITLMLIKSIGTTLRQYVFLCVILLTWDIILYTRLTEFHMFFLTYLNCLHNFQVDIFSNKEAILWRCTLKEQRSKLATILKMCCYRCFSKSLAKIYRTANLSNVLWCIWSGIQWSTHSVVFLTL